MTQFEIEWEKYNKGDKGAMAAIEKLIAQRFWNSALKATAERIVGDALFVEMTYETIESLRVQ